MGDVVPAIGPQARLSVDAVSAGRIFTAKSPSHAPPDGVEKWWRRPKEISDRSDRTQTRELSDLRQKAKA